MISKQNPAVRALETLIGRLHERGRLRVWSLVITVFGDAVVPRGGRVPLAVLQEIIERLRVEPGALRTAMSRLAADRWVEREKQGRNSYFSLNANGRHAFDLATRRIYAAGPPQWDGTWTVAIAPPGVADDLWQDLTSLGFVRINGGVYLRPEAADAPEAGKELAGLLVVHGESAEHPEALRLLWPSGEVEEAYRGFIDNHRPLLKALDEGEELGGIDAMAARTLVIHDWRRVVLRDPGLPAALLPENWPGEEARALAREISRHLSAQSEAWLDAAGLPPQIRPEQAAARWTRQPSQVDAQSSR
ncbi:PaaX family transcriptional regulator C-terminal domain-containing protein [Aquamicrobium sp. LC103]|uniref:PaaX family transcriptional regulator n=1 Tax=Aquamicrobium sp. LC103 TaxID=1120658 RepID=UPI00069C530F|nr:PaaX family transcriptional regulator C-terminal domain-containing protein [Aquamicrobium sp. LC103]TKT80193.1 phenylacetic acid degradation protein [Aquamicrobium sp. LC103]